MLLFYLLCQNSVKLNNNESIIKEFLCHVFQHMSFNNVDINTNKVVNEFR